MSIQAKLDDLRKILDRVITDKDDPHNYIATYEEEMTKTKDVSILEIGVAYGGSLLLWDSYFENATVCGVDLYPKFNGIVPDGIEYPVHVIDSIDKEACDATFKDETFDYIIDDGLHTVEAQLKTFDNYFSKLKSGGKYFIEDIELPENVVKIKRHLLKYDYQFYDFTSISQTPDDMMFVITKP
jgi:hypothetical protein